MSSARFTPPEAAKPAAPPADTSEAKWRCLTEELIFAAAYADDGRTGTRTWFRVLDATRLRYNRESATAKCMALCEHINAEGAHLPQRLLRAHLANDDRTFRLRFAHLLPKRPRMPRLGEQRTGVSDEERMRAADRLVGSMT